MQQFQICCAMELNTCSYIVLRSTKVIDYIIILQLYFTNKITLFLAHYSFIDSSLGPLHQVPTGGPLENTIKCRPIQSAETYELVHV